MFVGGLEINFGTLGCSEVRVLPCRCWFELSTQTFGEGRRSLYCLEQGKCVVGLVTGVDEEAVVGAGLEPDA